MAAKTDFAKVPGQKRRFAATLETLKIYGNSYIINDVNSMVKLSIPKVVTI